MDADVNHFDVVYPDLRQSESIQYYDSEKFNTEIGGTVGANDFSVVHINIRSISANIDSFLAYLSLLKCSFDIVCFSETWLNECGHLDDYFPNYRSFHSTRTNRRGGGVAIYSHKKLQCTAMESLTLNEEHLESIFIKIKTNHRNLVVGCCYRPPNSQYEIFESCIEEKMSSVCSQTTDLYVCGDFNVDLLRSEEEARASSFYSSMAALSLIPTISKPTRITDTSCTLIDNIFTTNLSNFISGIFTIEIADHLPIFIIARNYFTYEPKLQIKITYRVTNEQNMDKLYRGLIHDNLNDVFVEGDINLSLERLDAKIMHVFNTHCPIVTKYISPKDTLKPWINRVIKLDIKKRENYFKLYRRNLMTKQEYANFRNYVTSSIRHAKREYYRGKFSEVCGDTRKTWRILNNILSSTTMHKKSKITSILYNNKIYQSDKDICNVFNDHFATIAQKIDESIPNASNNNLSTNLIQSTPHSFFFSPVTVNSIVKIITSLKNKSAAISTYSTKILKYIVDIISPILSKIINKSLSTGHFPKSQKIAKVIPIHKSGDNKLVDNYRDISLLPLLSKIFEKVAKFQLTSYFEHFNLFTQNQFGFRQNQSTSNAIIHTLQYIYDNLDKGCAVVSVFLDFKKAFNCVNHEILLEKMSLYGVRGVAYDWFKSYLTDRQQYVSLNGEVSGLRSIDRGVPQGSILGPLLFLIFINDFPNITDFFKFTLFADDSTLTCSFKNTPADQIKLKINSELSKINNWLFQNRIKINAQKSNFISFSYRKPLQLNSLIIGTDTINEVQTTKFLGIILDQNLNFKSHINYIQSKLSRSVGILYKTSSLLPQNILKMLYNSLILPYITYGIESWFGASRTSSGAVEVLQKKAVRAIYNLPYNSHTIEYFKTGKLLKLTDLYNLNICSQLFNYINNENCDMQARIRTHSQMHSHNTRHSSNLVPLRFNRTTSQSSFIYRAITQWNLIPQNVKNCTSVRTFKHRLRDHYCCQY